MLPLPVASDVLASSTPTANSIFSSFSQYAWLEVGAIFGVLAILFIIGVFSGAFKKLFSKEWWDEPLTFSKEEKEYLKRKGW